MIYEKRPREYAYEIMQLKTKHQRREALDKVPDKYKDWVSRLVIIAFELRKTP